MDNVQRTEIETKEKTKQTNKQPIHYEMSQQIVNTPNNKINRAVGHCAANSNKKKNKLYLNRVIRLIIK